MAGRGDEIAPGAAGLRLRASHAERDQAIDVLKAAFIQGMLTKDELDMRVGQALTSRIRAELAALTADIPATLTPVQAPPRPAPQSGEGTFIKALASALVVIPSTMVGLALVGTHQLTASAVILHVILFACVVAVPASLLVMAHSWLDKYDESHASDGSPPSTPGGTFQHLAAADPSWRPTRISNDPPGTSHAARRRPWPPLPSSLLPHRSRPLGVAAL
jgi:hypothetical protein